MRLPIIIQVLYHQMYSWDEKKYHLIVHVHVLTFGPHLACLVTQQISSLHIEHLIQSQPVIFMITILH